MRTLESFSDADFRRTILRAIRLLLVLTLVALPLVWWRFGGWRGAAMLLVGAAISASGLWEWLRLLTAVMARMDGEMVLVGGVGCLRSGGTAGLSTPASPAVEMTPFGLAREAQGGVDAERVDTEGVAAGGVAAEAASGQGMPEEVEEAGAAATAPAKVRGMGMLLFGFFVRLAVVVLVLYGSLRYLEGSVVALAAGLGLGVFSLTVEGLRLVKAWTV